MEARGIIRGYHAATGGGTGLIEVVLFVTIAERPCERALRWFAALEGIEAVHSLAGETDAVAFAVLSGVEALTALNDRVAAAPFIAAARSHVVLRSLRGH